MTNPLNPQDLRLGDIIMPTGRSWSADMRGLYFPITAIDDRGQARFAGHTKDPEMWVADEEPGDEWAVELIQRAPEEPADEEPGEEPFPWETPIGEVPALEPDMVNHPPHYHSPSGLQVADFLDAFVGDDPQRWNAGKYIMRAGKKNPDKFVEDLEKAIWYLQRRIDIAKAGQ